MFVSDSFFFFAGHVRQVVILYGNDCMGMALAGLALVVLDEWSSYKCGRISRFEIFFI